MKTVKSFFADKRAGFYCTLGAAVCSIIGVATFAALARSSTESTENVPLVIAFAVITVALCAVAAYRDFFKAPTLLAFASSMITLAAFIKGRVSYVAFYISGDVMNTGLSPLFVIAAAFFVLAVASSIVAVCLKQEK